VNPWDIILAVALGSGIVSLFSFMFGYIMGCAEGQRVCENRLKNAEYIPLDHLEWGKDRVVLTYENPLKED
jgi:hypothetical protein